MDLFAEVHLGTGVVKLTSALSRLQYTSDVNWKESKNSLIELFTAMGR